MDKNKKRKNDLENLVILINDDNNYLRFFHKTESIIEGVLMIKSPDGSGQLLEMKDVFISSSYNFEKDDWSSFIQISNLSYKISRKSPYYSDYSMVMCLKTVSFIVLIVLAKPTLSGMPISGLLIDVGIKNHNYHQVAEITSALLRIIADDETRAILDKEWTEDFCKENDEGMLADYVDSASDKSSEYYDYTDDEEDELYE